MANALAYFYTKKAHFYIVDLFPPLSSQHSLSLSLHSTLLNIKADSDMRLFVGTEDHKMRERKKENKIEIRKTKNFEETGKITGEGAMTLCRTTFSKTSFRMSSCSITILARMTYCISVKNATLSVLLFS
jgi:hypothetical protein